MDIPRKQFTMACTFGIIPGERTISGCGQDFEWKESGDCSALARIPATANATTSVQLNASNEIANMVLVPHFNQF
jgi:hypothetical protein